MKEIKAVQMLSHPTECKVSSKEVLRKTDSISTPKLSQLMGRKLTGKKKKASFTCKLRPRRNFLSPPGSTISTPSLSGQYLFTGGLFSAPWRCPRNPFDPYRQVL